MSTIIGSNVVDIKAVFTLLQDLISEGPQYGFMAVKVQLRAARFHIILCTLEIMWVYVAVLGVDALDRC
jgi:hypothetical protein